MGNYWTECSNGNLTSTASAGLCREQPCTNLKYLSYILLIPLLILALTPPMALELDCKINSTFWLWMTFVSGFLAFLFLYQKVSAWLKLLVVWLFTSCFFSRAPYISFTMFWSVIVCAYYYAFCKKIKDFTPVKKSLQAVFFFITLLIIAQLFGKDVLLNFNSPNINVLGTIGNRMMSSSFVCILAPFLIVNPLNWIPLIIISFITWSSGAVLSIGAGLSVYAWARFKKMRLLIIVIAILAPILFAWKTGDIYQFTRAGRGPVYLKTLELSLQRPIGFGVGTYKVLFPVMCGKEIRKQQPGREWNTAHNDWLQMLFEMGFVGVILLMGWLISIVRKTKDPIKLAGLAILATNMMVHFPMRMVQCAFIILMYLAYCEGD
jgi:O-antigen ligase